MIRFTAEPHEAGVRPDRALRKRFPDIDRALALKILKNGRIRVAGEVARLATTLQPDDLVEVKLAADRAGAPHVEQSTVLFEGNGFVVVDKGNGLAMHEGTGVTGADETLRGRLAAAFKIEEDFSGPSFLGRLDRATSGLVIAALSRAGLEATEPPWRRGEVEKGYLALVHGKTEEGGVIELPLAARRPRHRGTGRTEEARTRFVTLAKGTATSLVMAFLDTGRTHQIRRHLKAIGHSVVFDPRYGDGRKDRKISGRTEIDPDAVGLMLHAWRYRHGGALSPAPDPLVAPVPERMRQVMTAEGIDPVAAEAVGMAAEPPFVEGEAEFAQKSDGRANRG